MEIKTNTIYHLPTQAHEDDFLRQADKEGYMWAEMCAKADVQRHWYNEEYCIRVVEDGLNYCDKDFYETAFSYVPIVEWKIGFTKADMQIGQFYKMRNGDVDAWDNRDIDFYANDLKPNSTNLASIDRDGVLDVIEVYPMVITPLWKREEPKYRVKTELTKEQAEKLGMELCEEVVGE